MTIRDVVAPLEEFAPLSYQDSFDNSGLIIGSYDTEIQSALVCVDATEAVVDEAVRLGAGLVISHHPIIFSGLKRLNSRSYVERVVEKAIRSGVALYACHTNLDSTPEGMSFRVAQKMGLKDLKILEPLSAENGYGVVGVLPVAEDLISLLERIKEQFSVGVVRYSEPVSTDVRKVAICTGSGGSCLGAAIASGAELYVSADFKYNHFLDATKLVTIADIGHFESEYCAIELICDVISKKIPTFALHKSEESRNPINYLA